MDKRFYKYVLQNVGGMIGVSVYVLADTFFISVAGGAEGIMILNLALPLYGLLFAIGSLIGIGSATKYALRKAQKKSDINEYFVHAIFWQVVVAIPFILIGIIWPESWLYIMGADKAIALIGKVYVKIVLIGSPFFMINYTFTAFTRNDNGTTIAMIAALTASGFNILFDYIFMFPLNMGIAGAALATAMAPILSSLICCIHIMSKKSGIKFVLSKVSFIKIVNCCKLGVSAFVGEISSAVTTTVFNFLLLNLVGNIGVSAYGVVANYALVGIAVFNGIAQGMQPLISEYFGKGKLKEINTILRKGITIVVIVEILLICMSYAFTEQFIYFFNSEGNKELALYAYDAIRLYFIGFSFAGINIVLITFFSSIGQALYASITAILRGAIAIIICAIGMGILFGVNGVWLSFCAAELVTFIVVIIFFHNIKKREFKLKS